MIYWLGGSANLLLLPRGTWMRGWYGPGSPVWSLPAFDPDDLAAGWGQGVSSVDDLPSAESTESFASESTLLGSGGWKLACLDPVDFPSDGQC